MTPEERLSLIERYATGLEAIQIALFRIGDHGLDEAPDGEWTPRQIVHHLADAELFRGARLRQLLAESSPALVTFDEREYAAMLDYSRPIEGSIVLLHALISTHLEILRGLPDDAWQRSGEHPDLGRFTMEDWLLRAANHGFEHAAQLESNAAWHVEGVHSTS
jgi:hypothetical protein